MDELQRIQAEIAQLQKQAEDMIAQRKAAIIEEIRGHIKAFGITAKDLGFSDKGPAKIVVPVKYRFHDQTWTGRGRQPKWVDDYLASGKSLEDILVK